MVDLRGLFSTENIYVWFAIWTKLIKVTEEITSMEFGKAVVVVVVVTAMIETETETEIEIEAEGQDQMKDPRHEVLVENIPLQMPSTIAHRKMIEESDLVHEAIADMEIMMMMIIRIVAVAMESVTNRILPLPCLLRLNEEIDNNNKISIVNELEMIGIGIEIEIMIGIKDRDRPKD